jgi:hypothetical protein
MPDRAGIPEHLAETRKIEEPWKRRDQAKAMQCDNCEKIFESTPIEAYRKVTTRNFIEFNFCSVKCYVEFENEVWESHAGLFSKASKQAKRKTEGETSEASASAGTMVEGITGQR